MFFFATVCVLALSCLKDLNLAMKSSPRIRLPNELEIVVPVWECALFGGSWLLV